jgi:ASPIC and UnbV/FG-GAP-like repeat
MFLRIPRHRPVAVAALRISFAAILLVPLFLAFGNSRGNPQDKPAQPLALAYFTDIAKQAGLTMTNVFGGVNTKKYIIETTGTGVAIFDADNDGWPDIFIVNGTKLEGFPAGEAPTNHFYHNNHDGTFTDMTKKAGLSHTGWGQGVCIGDYDNDGFEDLYVTYYGKNVLYHNNGNGTFTDISAASGPGVNTVISSRGLAIGDLWNDGRLSAVVNNMNAPPSLLVNKIRAANHWVAFRTIGAFINSPSRATRSNRDAIGARIRVKAGNRTLIDEVRSGSSFISNNDMRVHFGLGPATKIDWAEVRWPGGLVEKFDNLSPDSIHTLKEGTTTAAVPANEKLPSANPPHRD